MSAKVRMVLLACVVVAVAIVASLAVATSEVAVSTDAVAAEKCCFTNPRYSGVCEVTPGEGETCSSILGYLNNPNSSGKAYCGGTAVRGGWSQVACE
jgi:hypothetical protein